MNVACPGCGTRYAVSDDKVRGRRVRITCKHCSAPIVVDGTIPNIDSELSSAVSDSDLGSKNLEDTSQRQEVQPQLPAAKNVAASPFAQKSKPAVEPKAPVEPLKTTPVEGGPATSTEATNATRSPVQGPKLPAASKGVPAAPKPLSLGSAATSLKSASPRAPAVDVKPAVIAPKPDSVRPPAVDVKPAVVAPKPDSVRPPAAVVKSAVVAPKPDSVRPPAAVVKPAVVAPKTDSVRPPAAVVKPAVVAPKPDSVRPPAEPKPVATVATVPIAPIPRSMTPLAVPTVQRQSSSFPPNQPKLAPGGGPSAPRATRPQRPMHATIIGVAAPANPPPQPVAPPIPADTQEIAQTAPIAKVDLGADVQANTVASPVQTKGSVAHGIRRNPKQTMIGGLEAAPGSAPSPQAVGLGIPTEMKWTVLLANTGAEVMSAPDIVRAFVDGRIRSDAKLWKEGLDGWKSLTDIEPIRQAFQRAGIPLQKPDVGAEPEQRPVATTKIGPRSPDTATSKAPVSFRPAAATKPAEVSWDDESKTRARVSPELNSPELPRTNLETKPTQESSLGDVPNLGSTSPRSFPPVDAPEPLPVPPISRPDIGPRETIRGELSSGPSLSSPPPPDSSESPRNLAAPQTELATSLGGGTELNPNAPDGPDALTQFRPKVKRKSRRRLGLVVWMLVVIGFVTMLALSYRFRQPQVLYGYLHRKHWDKPLDTQIQRIVIRPYRSIERQISSLFHKTKGK